MKVLLAVEQTRISVGAIRILTKLTLPGGSDLILLHVNPIPQKLTGLAKERILKISQQVQEVQKDALEQARLFLGKVEQTLQSAECEFFSDGEKGISWRGDFKNYFKEGSGSGGPRNPRLFQSDGFFAR